MSQSRNWVIYYHSWPCPTHDSTNFLAHLRLVAVNRTFLASRLSSTELASRQTRTGITDKLTILLGHFPYPKFMTAVQLHHSAHNPLFTLNASHNQDRKSVV